MKSLFRKQILLAGFSLVLLLTQTGFDYAKHSIPLNEIHDGGPPKDGIPALYDPKFIPAQDAQYLKTSDRILGLDINGEVKAYPLKILNWHEIVNDSIGGQDVLVSFCPLCGTGMAFDANIKDKRFLFGVSGKLYNSDMLMYDKETQSLWSQIKMEAVTGAMTGEKLVLLPLIHTTWGAWTKRYPNTKVLSKQTGFSRDYAKSPYDFYEQGDTLMFPVNHDDSRLPRKSWVVGVIINGKPKAYSFKRLREKDETFQDVVGGEEVRVHYDKENQSAVIKDAEGNILPSTQAYWFAWVAFYPKTELYF